MGCIQVDDQESTRTRGPRKVEQEDARDVERVGSTVGDPAEEAKMQEGRGGAARESGAGQGDRGLCAPLGLKGPGEKVQNAAGQSYDVHADMFRKDNIPKGEGQGDQCWRCTKEAGQIPWPVLQMTAWAFPNATMRTTDTRGQWWGLALRLPKEVREDEGAQGDVEVWWGEGKEGRRTGVQFGWDTVRGLQEEDDGVAVSFRMTDKGRPDEEAPIVPVGHKCAESARRIRLTVHALPADRVWYLVLVQAYLEQGRAKGVPRSGGDEGMEGQDGQ